MDLKDSDLYIVNVGVERLSKDNAGTLFWNRQTCERNRPYFFSGDEFAKEANQEARFRCALVAPHSPPRPSFLSHKQKLWLTFLFLFGSWGTQARIRAARTTRRVLRSVQDNR